MYVMCTSMGLYMHIAYVCTVYSICCHWRNEEFQLFHFYSQLKIWHTNTTNAHKHAFVQFHIMSIDDDNLFRWIKLLMRFCVRTCVLYIGGKFIYRYTNVCVRVCACVYLLFSGGWGVCSMLKRMHPFIHICCSLQLLLHIFGSISSQQRTKFIVFGRFRSWMCH